LQSAQKLRLKLKPDINYPTTSID